MLLNQFIRYAEIASIIVQGEFDTILEVGSGTRGMVEFISRQIIGCDLSFLDYAKGRPMIHPRIKPVMADVLFLPFRDRSFELVISSDMLEHIPATQRPGAIRELCRVASSMVILSFPCGELAFDFDRKLRELYMRRKKPVPQWLSEHLERGFPDEEEITSLLFEWGLDFHVMGNENLLLHYLIMVLESCSRLKFKLSAVAELLNPHGDVPQRLSSKARIAQRMLRRLAPLKSLVSIGPTYRRIFVIQV